ncbi:MAG: site-specific integrase, partial [Terracidiphilus sp.]
MKAKRARYQQGSIRKIARANGFAWEVRFSETVKGKRTRKTLIFPTDRYPKEKDVRTAIQSQVALANTENDRAKVGATFGTITELYRSDHLPGLRHSTQRVNGFLLKDYIEPRWTDETIADVTPLKVLNWLGELGELAPTTKAAIRSIMSQCFQLAALHGYIPATERNPMSVVPIKGTSKREKEIVILTPHQFKRLVAELPAPLNLMVLLTGSLGLRVGETLALHWSDIDWNEKTVTIQRNFTHQQIGDVKTDSSRAVLPLDNALAKLLKGHKKTTGESVIVFPSSRTGGYQSSSMLLQKGIHRAATKLRLGRVTWHSLRHSCRSWLDAKHVPVGVQKDLLRHADISTTMNRYGRALAPEMRTS